MSRPIGSQEHLEKRRQRAIALLKEGWSVLAVARKMGCARSAVYAWWTIFRRHGLRGLQAAPVPGRPPKLTPRQKRALSRILLAGAPRPGYSTDPLTPKGGGQGIQGRLGGGYHSKPNVRG